MACVETLHFTAKVVSVSPEAFGSGRMIEISAQDECMMDIKALYAQMLLPQHERKDDKVGDIWVFLCFRAARVDEVNVAPSKLDMS